MSTPARLFDRMILAVDPTRRSQTGGRDRAPAVVVGVNADNGVNLRVFYDGPDVGWVTGVTVYTSEAEWRAHVDDDAFSVLGCWLA